jgi:uncharacterized protein with HEPN domain
MSTDSILAKCAFILKMIENIRLISERQEGIVNALSDEIESRPAILMALLQIGETLNKFDTAMLDRFDLSIEAKGSYDVRNFIAHDYMGVDLGLVESVIRGYLPILEEKIKNMSKFLEKTI